MSDEKQISDEEMIYKLYQNARKFVEAAKSCEKAAQHWERLVKIFDTLDTKYSDRYEKEKSNEGKKNESSS